MEKNQKNALKITKDQKDNLTLQAFWHFAAGLKNRQVDLLDFQKKIKSIAFPNRAKATSKEDLKLQNSQDVFIKRLVQNSLPKMFPNIEIVREKKNTHIKKKFRPYIRLRTYNFQNAEERRQHKEFLNSKFVKMTKFSNVLLAKNIIANKHLIKKYGLLDRKGTDGITAKFSAKNIQKWKEGEISIPAPLLLLVTCAVHKYAEKNQSVFNRGRPRMIKGVDKQELEDYSEQLYAVNGIYGLSDFSLFNAQIIQMTLSNHKWYENIWEIAKNEWLTPEATADAIWNLYQKEITYNPKTNEDNFFTKKDVLDEVQKVTDLLEEKKASIELLKNMGLVKENASESDINNAMIKQITPLIAAANKKIEAFDNSDEEEDEDAFNTIIREQQKKSFGELALTHLDHSNLLMTIYTNIYKEFKLIESSGAYVKPLRKVSKRNDPVEESVIVENEENKLENPEDYFGI